MKTTYLILLFLIAFTAKSQCVIDTTQLGGTNYVFPDTLPCAVIGSMYDTTVQIYLPKTIYVHEILPSFPFNPQVRVDSIQIDSITGFPDSLLWNMNPSSRKIYGGHYGCFGVFGKVTAADTGVYNISVWGTTWFNVLGKDTLQKGDFSAVFPVRINVIQPGTPCYNEQLPNAISTVSSSSGVSVFPNPFSTQMSIQTENEQIEKVQLFDKIGRMILMQENIHQSSFIFKTENLISSGIYTLKIATNKSTYSRSVSFQ